jgi:hypothetical protein
MMVPGGKLEGQMGCEECKSSCFFTFLCRRLHFLGATSQGPSFLGPSILFIGRLAVFLEKPYQFLS